MSGIVGLWNVDDRPVDRATLAGMCATLRHRAVDGEDLRIDGPIAFAHQHLLVTPEETAERQPLASAAGVWLAMDGRLDNRDDLLHALALPPTASDAACVLAAYGHWGDSFPERLNGEFAIAIADVPARTVLLVRDVVGVRPLYYVQTPRFFAFASEIKALLAHPDVPHAVDDEGLADYLMIGARPLDRQEITCFAHVRAVVPSHVVRMTCAGVASRRYWDFEPARALRLKSFADYVEVFRTVFAEAVRRRARAGRPIAVSVSGGLDSSSIWCQAETLRRSGRITAPAVLGISYVGAAGSDADEREYLRAIEDEYRVSIERFAMEPLTGLVRGAEHQVWAIEAPFLEYMWGITEELQRRAVERGSRVLLSGQWGDQVLFSSAYLVDLCRDFAWRTLRAHVREYRRWFGDGEADILARRAAVDFVRRSAPRALLGPLKWARRRLSGEHQRRGWFGEAFRRRALQFADRPATIGDGFHSAHAQSIYLEARSKYHVQCLEWNNKVGALHGLDVSFPFLDRDLLGFLIAAPGEWQNRDGVPRALLREAMRGILPDAVRARKWKADFSGVVNRGVAADADRIADRLSNDSLAARLGYVDAARLRPRLAELRSPNDGTCVVTWDIADLYGLELWLQRFVGGGRLKR